jgi:hypothetical protein
MSRDNLDIENRINAFLWGKHGIDHHLRLNYFSPIGFFYLWDWAKEQSWWENFVAIQGFTREGLQEYAQYVKAERINYQTFPIELARFLGWTEDHETAD